ncbi:MAG: hypothetical protein ABJQ93_01720, partial [Luteolibacter sp.]
MIERQSVVLEMACGATHSKMFSTLTFKSFYTRKFNHRHPIKDEVAQMASEPDLGIGGHSTTAASMYTLLGKRRVVNATKMAR